MHSALRNNFLNTLDTTATRLAEALAFDLYSERHIDFLKPVMFVQHEEMCGTGSSPIIDMLIGSNHVCLSEESQTIKVQWLWKVKPLRAVVRKGHRGLPNRGTMRGSR